MFWFGTYMSLITFNNIVLTKCVFIMTCSSIYWLTEKLRWDWCVNEHLSNFYSSFYHTTWVCNSSNHCTIVQLAAATLRNRSDERSGSSWKSRKFVNVGKAACLGTSNANNKSWILHCAEKYYISHGIYLKSGIHLDLTLTEITETAQAAPPRVPVGEVRKPDAENFIPKHFP